MNKRPYFGWTNRNNDNLIKSWTQPISLGLSNRPELFISHANKSNNISVHDPLETPRLDFRRSPLVFRLSRYPKPNANIYANELNKYEFRWELKQMRFSNFMANYTNTEQQQQQPAQIVPCRHFTTYTVRNISHSTRPWRRALPQLWNIIKCKIYIFVGSVC